MPSPVSKKNAAILVSYKVSDTDWKLAVSDNGGGKPDLSAFEKKGGLGTSLVKSLAKQLDAGVQTVSDNHGTAVTITHATFKTQPLKAAQSIRVNDQRAPIVKVFGCRPLTAGGASTGGRRSENLQGRKPREGIRG